MHILGRRAPQWESGMERSITLVWCGVVFALAIALLNLRHTSSVRDDSHTLVVNRDGSARVGQTGATDGAESSKKNGALFSVTVRRPDGPPTVAVTTEDPQGRRGEIACSTCHSVREPVFENRTPADLDQFHQNMPMAHGKLACYACHNPDDADTLRLADSTVVEYPDVMDLCAQCHGTQARDFNHGAHGGMNGFWDLTRGPRTRNNCIDCHDPHVPQFPSMQPSFKPRDRFLEASKSHSTTSQARMLSSEASRE